jgi:hypothetical protein
VVQAVGLMSVPLVLMVLLLYLEGGFVVKSSNWLASGQTFSFFSMNLSAPVNPALGLMPDKSSLRSMFIDPRPLATGGQYEGYNYIGFGIILLAFTALSLPIIKACVRLKTVGALAVCPRIPRLILYPTVISAVLLTAFAASHKVTWEGSTLFTVPIPDKLLSFCEIFRSSGRFFWPVSYLIMWLVFWRCSSLLRHKPVILTGILHVALALQLVDFSQFIHQYSVASRATPATYNSPLKSGLWPGLMKKYRRIYYYPSSDLTYCFPIGLLAAPNKVSMNISSTARSDPEKEEKARKQVLQELQTGQLRRNSLYIFRDVGLFNSLKVKLESRAGSIVRELDGFYVAGL